jgi:hypothetical protein
VSLTPYAWAGINLSQDALAWIVKGSMTRLALIHELVLADTAPAGQNDAMLSLAEDPAHAPYLQVTYLLP